MEYKISKSQKKVLKRLHRFLSQGDTKAGDDSKSAGGSFVTSDNHGENAREFGVEVVVHESREFVICSVVNCFVLCCKAVLQLCQHSVFILSCYRFCALDFYTVHTGNNHTVDLCLCVHFDILCSEV